MEEGEINVVSPLFHGDHRWGSSFELLQFEMSVCSDVAQLELAKEKLSEEVANIRKDKVMSKAVALVLRTRLCITHVPLQAGSSMSFLLSA